MADKRSIRAWFLGLSLIALLLVVYFAFVAPWPGKESSAATIGGVDRVERYRQPVVGEKDVLLGDTTVQKLLQNDKVLALLRDPAFRRLLKDPRAASFFQSDAARSWLANRELTKNMASVVEFRDFFAKGGLDIFFGILKTELAKGGNFANAATDKGQSDPHFGPIEIVQSDPHFGPIELANSFQRLQMTLRSADFRQYELLAGDPKLRALLTDKNFAAFFWHGTNRELLGSANFIGFLDQGFLRNDLLANPALLGCLNDQGLSALFSNSANFAQLQQAAASFAQQ